MKPIEELKSQFNLTPHPEGGFASLLYEDTHYVSLEKSTLAISEDRPCWNGIYYLIPKGEKCVLHRIKMTELWNFYHGDPIQLVDISPDGSVKKPILGSCNNKAWQPAYVFEPGHWIGAQLIEGSEFAFMSCITAPGFNFQDWEKGEAAELAHLYPHLKELIRDICD